MAGPGCSQNALEASEEGEAVGLLTAPVLKSLQTSETVARQGQKQPAGRARLVLECCGVVGGGSLFYAMFHNPLCGAIFQCGCTWDPWLGGTGWKLCNVHNPDMSSVRCPWCISPESTPQWTWTTGATCVVGSMALVWLVLGWKIVQSERGVRLCCGRGVKERVSSRMKRVVAPFIWFFVFHSISGLIFALCTGYPYWFFLTFPDTQTRTAPMAPVLAS